jgi:tetratricopeptide (TPR) repeat protein
MTMSKNLQIVINIVTTNNSNTKNNNFISNFVQIGELSPKEKLTLFLKIMDDENFQELISIQNEQANTFLNDLPPYPLDISIAAYYLKSTHTPYGEYLERLKENHNDFDNVQADVVKEASGYTKTRYGIITLSTKELITIHKDFQDLLLLMGLIGHQNIPKSLLTQYKGHTIADNFIYHLKKYSLVTNDSFSNAIPTISIHKKTQETILSYLVNTLMLSDKSPQLHTITATVENYILDAVDKEDFSRMKLLAPHGELLLNRDDLLSEATKSSLRGALGCVYYYLKHYPKIKQFLEENLVDLKRHYGEKHDKIARILIYLGNFYRSLGDYKRAKTLLEQSLVICKENPNHIRSAKALGYLGAVYRDLGDYKQAKVFFEQSLAIYEKYSPNSIGHAWILTYLGNIHRILGNYEKAKVFLEQSFAIYKEASEDYAGTAWALGYIGTVYRLLGDYQTAKDYIEKALSITKKYFSDDHIYVASHTSALAKVYIKIGDYQTAKTLLKGSLNVYEKNYGQNHVGTASVLRRLGACRNEL